MVTSDSKKTRWRWPKCEVEASKRQFTNQWATSQMLSLVFIQSMYCNVSYCKYFSLTYCIFHQRAHIVESDISILFYYKCRPRCCSKQPNPKSSNKTPEKTFKLTQMTLFCCNTLFCYNKCITKSNHTSIKLTSSIQND